MALADWKGINKKIAGWTGLFGAIAVISMLLLLPGTSVKYENWPDCKQVSEEKEYCYAKFLINVTNASVYFSIDDMKTIPGFSRRTSASLWLNTSRYGFVTTDPLIVTELFVPTVKSQSTDKAPDGKYIRPIETGDFIQKGKAKALYVRGTKHPAQAVEWKNDLLAIDPVWDASMKSGIWEECTLIKNEKKETFDVSFEKVSHQNGSIENKTIYTKRTFVEPVCKKTKKKVTLDLAEFDFNKFMSVKENSTHVVIEGDDSNKNGFCQYGERDCHAYEK